MNSVLKQRLELALDERDALGLTRSLRLSERSDGRLDLANNDYFGLSQDPEIVEAACWGVKRYGCSASASPLVTGFGPAHRDLLDALKTWHGYPSGLIWNSGYAANQAILGTLPRKGDIVLADRLIHNSMISGILKSGARLVRYGHCDVQRLGELLEAHADGNRMVFVVTESVFSMDGDYPDLAAIAALKERYGFVWLVDEAHALGWYGRKGSGLVESSGVGESVDILVGTLGKALGSMGAYSLFLDEKLESYLVNFAEEFIYSTYLAPSAACAARKSIERLRSMEAEREGFAAKSIFFRRRLEEHGLQVSSSDSPIVSVNLGDLELAVETAARLKEQGIVVGAIRPPTVPEGTSRLRISLKANLERERLTAIADEIAGAVVAAS